MPPRSKPTSSPGEFAAPHSSEDQPSTAAQNYAWERADALDDGGAVFGLRSPDPLPDPLGADAGRGPSGAGARALAALSPGGRAVKALAVVATIVVVVSAFLAWRSRPAVVAVGASAPPVAIGAPPAAGAPTQSPTSVSPNATAMLVIAVEGKVRHPGLVRVASGSRIADAIDAAGGPLPGTDLSFVNIAQKVVDGELIVIGETLPPGAAVPGAATLGGGPGAGGGGSAAPGSPINLNSASAAELDTLPGIGPELAQRIIDYRTQHGAFHSIDELRNVSGIGDAKFAEIKDLVTV